VADTKWFPFQDAKKLDALPAMAEIIEMAEEITSK